MRQRIGFVCLIAVAASGATGDQAPATTAEIVSHDTPTTFSTRVNLVMVPVVVRDKSGHAIGTLTKDDFSLFDKGKPQLIMRFSVEKAEKEAVSPTAPKVGESEIAPGADPSAIPTRFTAYLFDDEHLSFGDLAQSREAAKKHIAESMRPTDRAAVMTTSGKNMLEFTDDQEKIRETMDKIVPRQRANSLIECPPMTYYEADQIENFNDPIALQTAITDAQTCRAAGPGAALRAVVDAAAMNTLNIGEAETQVTLVTLKDMVRRMAALPGQRTLVLISPGFHLTMAYRQDESDLIERAIKANVVINALDARGLYVIEPGGLINGNYNPKTAGQRDLMQRQSAIDEGDTLGEISEGTGGSFFHNSNDLMDGFRKMAAAPEFTYLLGFSPQNLKLDGSYHALKVTVAAKGYDVKARRGYYAPKHMANPEETAKEEIREAIFSREEVNDIPVQLQTQFFKPSLDSAKLAVVAKVDLRALHYKKEDGRNRNTLVIVTSIFDRNGNLVSAIQKNVEMRLKEETFEARIAAGISVKTSFDLTPGSYAVRLVLRDSEGDMMAARNGVVQIP